MPGAEASARFAADVREFLLREPRQLPSRYFYDPLGSALFDAICELPWYGITRAESRLLARHRDELHDRLDRLTRVIELGPGSGDKLGILLERRRRPQTLDVHLVDVSERALATAADTLDRLGVRIVTHAAEYIAGLRDIGSRTDTGEMTLVLFLGSNIGNFDPPQAALLLHAIRDTLTDGDALLLGADLVKPERDLQLAYDDPLGVTAAFNRNLLVRINRELGGNFDVAEFTHQAFWNKGQSRIEMHLVARSPQQVSISGAGLDFTLAPGERIWTESSYKYQPDDVTRLLRHAGFHTTRSWTDDRDRFLLTLAIAGRGDGRTG